MLLMVLLCCFWCLRSLCQKKLKLLLVLERIIMSKKKNVEAYMLMVVEHGAEHQVLEALMKLDGNPIINLNSYL